MAHVTGLHIYPVKSMRGVNLDSAIVQKRGLAGDRRWLATDLEGRFLTQRELAVLATVTAKLVGQELILSAEGFGQASVYEPSGATREVVIWGSTVQAHDAGDMIAEWLSAVLGVEARLVYMSEASVRPVHKDFSQPGDEVSFADGFPILLTTDASLSDLNSRMAAPVTMDRFRPNIVVSGFDALEEDHWAGLRIGNCEFRCPKLCGRCIVTTTDQKTGERLGPEPIQTLTQYRLQGQAAIFGVNLTPDLLGTIKIGDPVVPL